ncbi:hypothetical protein IG631_02107 [Alternaria alternata]|nr:hypothetical protein IG631_02107 [Alternaria alternata]
MAFSSIPLKLLDRRYIHLLSTRSFRSPPRPRRLSAAPICRFRPQPQPYRPSHGTVCFQAPPPLCWFSETLQLRHLASFSCPDDITPTVCPRH